MKGENEREVARPSKSAQKREAERLKQVGKRIAQLNDKQIASLDLPLELSEAVHEYRGLNSNGALRRQLQYIGKLLRDIDTDAVEEGLKALEGATAEVIYAHHQVEQWRDALLTNPDSLTEYLAQHPHTDAQALRALLKRIAKTTDEKSARKHRRELFRFLRDNATT